MKSKKCVPINNISASLSGWFKSRPGWLQEAARRFLVNGSVTAADIDELTLLCKKAAGLDCEEANGLVAQPVPEQSFSVTEPSISIRLESISEVSGINNLAPRKPLEFGTQPLTIIYGLSGSGKSGYMRILKRVCGAKGIKPLHGNVFAEARAEKSCKIAFTTGGTKKEVIWTPDAGIHAELAAVSLYDTDCAHVYVNDQNEVTYEPALLKLFRSLVEVCEKVDGALAVEISNEASTKPIIDADLSMTAAANWFSQISRETLDADVVLRCAWDGKLDEERRLLGLRLAEVNPAEKAATLRKTKGHLTQLISTLRTITDELADASFASFVAVKQAAKTRREAASVDARKVFENAPLEGIGSESWRLLWKQAKKYSESEAYKGQAFPNVDSQARCPLCQQQLDSDARSRFVSFESFVMGNLEMEAIAAEKIRDSFFDEFTDVPQGEALSVKLDLAGLNDSSLRDVVEQYCRPLASRRQEFLTVENSAGLSPSLNEGVFGTLSGIADSFDKQAKLFDEDTKTDQKEELAKRFKELTAQKWLSQQRQAIDAEIRRLNKIHLLRKAQALTHTRALSDKKAELAEVLVTEAFRERFEEELTLLGAARLSVRIEKTETQKGQVFHQIKMKDAKQPARAAEILSEGEFRIVSIAAFLADVEGKGGDTPFVFDDPISSLDQPFEEATAERLVNLSKARQVIVFTHRLSMMVLLEDAAKKQGIEPITRSVRSESWGTGEPSETPIWAKKPGAVLNDLLGHRLPRARKMFEKDGRASYEPVARAICGDIRIAVERMVETNLLNDVVHRFRRAIQTQNRIEALAKIKPEDCRLIDNFMTKYSRFEHSQSNETPVPPPDPDEIERDLKELKVWFDEFKTRAVPAGAVQGVPSASQAA